ncbi:hypothetical protein CEXT_306911 [Caerostris extrusa]|uniref:Uncharacterized protein n=1 Tax=Caerostris extrusa TaxID=172846 RepID=A0AAV4XTW9_CAEEX|nr:hypothetical protein CEXT_306911 [Caerostris extrusa]
MPLPQKGQNASQFSIRRTNSANTINRNRDWDKPRSICSTPIRIASGTSEIKERENLICAGCVPHRLESQVRIVAVAWLGRDGRVTSSLSNPGGVVDVCDVEDGAHWPRTHLRW